MPSTTSSTPIAAHTPSAFGVAGTTNVSGGGGHAEAFSLDLLRVARSQIPRSSSPAAAMEAYRAFRDKIRQPVLSTYNILGFLSSGTYGRVYKASLKHAHHQQQQHHNQHHHHHSHHHLSHHHAQSSRTSVLTDDETSGTVFAIKKFKPDKEDHATYTGISQSAMREIALVRELRHENIIQLREVILEDKSIYMVFHYASHDLLQLIHHHSSVLRQPIALPVLKSLLFQLLNGVHYLHSQFVLHRDLKPANILLTCNGIIKIADLGLARLYHAPLQSLYSGDKVVVTIWYRAPELLLGARHYNAKIDMWAVGCIWGELLALRPMFKGEEAKMDPKTKTTPFQSDQITRIVEIMGAPTKERWPSIENMPDYKHLWPLLRLNNHSNTLYSWYEQRAGSSSSSSGFDLFDALLQYDPNRRLSAKDALMHPWFQSNDPLPTSNAFASLPNASSIYPARRLIKDESDPKMVITQPTATGVASAVGGGNTGMGGGANNMPYGAGGSLAGTGVQGSAPHSGSAAGFGGSGAGIMAGGHSSIGVATGGMGAGQQSVNNASNSFSSAVGPPAPPPAPGSTSSVGPPSSVNSVGPTTSTNVVTALGSNSVTGAGGAGSSSAASNAAVHGSSAGTAGAGGGAQRGTGNTNMVATATANAANAAGRQAKRPRKA